VTSQKTTFFIVTAVKTSNLTCRAQFYRWTTEEPRFDRRKEQDAAFKAALGGDPPRSFETKP
jgi:hypothetical protein